MRELGVGTDSANGVGCKLLLSWVPMRMPDSAMSRRSKSSVNDIFLVSGPARLPLYIFDWKGGLLERKGLRAFRALSLKLVKS